MATSLEEIRYTDLTALEKLANQWRAVHKDIGGLSKRMHDQVLAPLRDKGYWEGVAAPYAWRMIDDIQRQLEAAAKVASAVTRVIDDAVDELKAVKTALEEAIRRAEAQGWHVLANGSISSVVDGQCKVREDGSDEAKAVDAVEQEIADLVRRGTVADRNLAYALMSDIGLGTWFNSDPEHTSINTTNRICEAEYNALARAMNGQDPYPAFNSDSPYDLGLAWVTGSGSRTREYRDGDEMTELIRASVSMDQLYADTIAQWRDEGRPNGTVSYSISESGKLGALRKLIFTDLPAIATADEDHLGEAFMGSYSLDYKIQGQDPDGTLIVEYTLDNSTSNESFLHYIGYYDWLSKFNREEGAFSTVHQKITWIERVPSEK